MFHIFSKRIRDCKKKKKKRKKAKIYYCVDKTRSSTHTFHSHRVIFCFSCRFLRVSIHGEHQQQSQNYIYGVCWTQASHTPPAARQNPIEGREEISARAEMSKSRPSRWASLHKFDTLKIDCIGTRWHGMKRGLVFLYLNYTLCAIHWLLLVWPIHIEKKRERAKQNLSLCDAWNTRIIK